MSELVITLTGDDSPPSTPVPQAKTLPSLRPKKQQQKKAFHFLNLDACPQVNIGVFIDHFLPKFMRYIRSEVGFLLIAKSKQRAGLFWQKNQYNFQLKLATIVFWQNTLFWIWLFTFKLFETNFFCQQCQRCSISSNLWWNFLCVTLFPPSKSVYLVPEFKA